MAVKFKPLHDSGIRQLGHWIQSQSWEGIYNAKSAHAKVTSNLKPTPDIAEHKVYEYLKSIKTNTATVKDDVPARIIKKFACDLSVQLTDVIKCILMKGEYPNIWKIESVPPLPKVYHTMTVNDLSKMAGLKISLK